MDEVITQMALGSVLNHSSSTVTPVFNQLGLRVSAKYSRPFFPEDRARDSVTH